MDGKRVEGSGIRMEIIQGTGEAVAVDELIDDLIHGNMRGVLHALHEPHKEAAEGEEIAQAT